MILLIISALIAQGEGLPAPPEAAEADAEEEALVVSDLLQAVTSRLAMDRAEEGRAALAARPSDLPGALDAFRQAHELAPKDDDIATNLADVLARLGNLDDSAALLRTVLERTPDHLSALLLLADVYSQRGDQEALDAAQRLLERARESGGNRASIIKKQATVARLRGDSDTALRFYRQVRSASPDDEALLVELGDYHRELGDDDEAMRWYRRVSKESPEHTVAQQRLEQIDIERQARRFGWTPHSSAPSEHDRTIASRVESLIARNRFGEALALVQQLVDDAPLFALAHRLEGDIHSQRGDITLAQHCYLRGLAIEPNDATLLSALASSYRKSTPPRHAEAAVLLTRALQIRPDWDQIRLDRASSLRAIGDLPEAYREIGRYLERANDSESRRDAGQALADELAALLDAPAPTVPAVEESDLTSCLNKARVLLQRGDTQAALAALDCGQDPAIAKLRARIFSATGRYDEARAILENLLEVEPQRSDLRYEYAGLLEREGKTNKARTEYLRAEAAGSIDATFQLARIDLERLRSSPFQTIDLLPDVLRRLDAYLQKPGASFSARARENREELRRLLFLGFGATAGLLLVVVTLMVSSVRRRRSGMSLAKLLRSAPDAGPEAQRILAAIRHEILKHHITALRGLVRDLESGDADPDALERFGEAILGPHGARERFLRYVDQLEALGRSHGKRLNLQRHDPIVATLHDGFEMLRRERARLASPSLSPSKRRKLVERLRQASRRLNDDAYRRVHDLLQELRETTIVERDLRDLYAQTAGEAAFAATDIAPLELIQEVEFPVAALVTRPVFEDMLTNLYRNALEAMRREAVVPLRVGVRLRTVIDDITGLETLAIAVLDVARAPLAPKIFETAPLESGLGIVRECAERCSASIRIVDAPLPWTKGIEISIPVPDAPLPDSSEQEESLV